MGSETVVYPYKPAVLADKKGDLSKPWTVNYYVWSEKKGELVRKRGTFNHSTAAERYADAAEFIKVVNDALKEGQIVDRIESDNSDLLLTPKTPLVAALNIFLEIRGKTIGTRFQKSDNKLSFFWLSFFL